MEFSCSNLGWLSLDSCMVIRKGMYMCVYVCMYVYMYVLCIYVCLYVCMYFMYVRIYVCTYFMYVCIYICMYVCMYVCLYVFTPRPTLPRYPLTNKPVCSFWVRQLQFRMGMSLRIIRHIAYSLYWLSYPARHLIKQQLQLLARNNAVIKKFQFTVATTTDDSEFASPHIHQL